MNKNMLNLHKKNDSSLVRAFFIGAAANLFFLAHSAKASKELEPELDARKTSFKENILKKSEDFIGIFPQEVWESHIYPQLATQELNTLARASRQHYPFARRRQIMRDPRCLHESGWVNGPNAGTFDAYLLNSMLWCLGRQLLESVFSHTPDDALQASYQANLATAMEFSKSHFKPYPSTEMVFSILDNFKSLNNLKAVDDLGRLAQTPINRAENDFLLLLRYAKARGCFSVKDFSVTIENGQPRNLVEHHYYVRQTSFVVRQKENDEEKPPLWENILRFSPGKPHLSHIIEAAQCYYVVGLNAPHPSEKLLSFMRSAELYEEYFNQTGTCGESRFMLENAQVHFNVACHSLNKDQRLSSLKRALQLYAQYYNFPDKYYSIVVLRYIAEAHNLMSLCLKEPHQLLLHAQDCVRYYQTYLNVMAEEEGDVDEDDYTRDVKNAALAYKRLAGLTPEPDEKLSILQETARLFDYVLACEEDLDELYLEQAAQTYKDAGDLTRAQEVRALLQQQSDQTRASQ